jgi:beta-phosphoglucomutase-like phosphatase (HAD superfamily)
MDINLPAMPFNRKDLPYKSTFIFDYDGTLSLLTELRQMLAKEQRWDEYLDACDTDVPNLDVIELLRILSRTHRCIIITGRADSVRDKSIRYLERYGVDMDNVEMYMRPHGDWRPDHDIKKMILEQLGITPAKVVSVFEDRPSMIAKWREWGYTCMQVCESENF